MAFGAEELRVLRRALALALHPGTASAEDVQDCFRLAESLDEALDEAARLRAFLLADLGRYRAALPATATGYLSLLAEALDTGHRPTPDDLAALKALSGNPQAATLLAHCRGVPNQQQGPAAGVRAPGAPPTSEDTTPTAPPSTPPSPKTPALPAPAAPACAGAPEPGTSAADPSLAAQAPVGTASAVLSSTPPSPEAPALPASAGAGGPGASATGPVPVVPAPAPPLAVPAALVASSALAAPAAPVPGVPAAAILASELPAAALVPAVIELPVSRTRLLALPGGAAEPGKPGRKPGAPAPERPATEPEQPKRPVPTPGEVFPPRKPTTPPDPTSEQLAAG